METILRRISRLTALSLCLALTIQDGRAAVKDTLDVLFNQLTYDLTVEWDQEDKAFYTERMIAFQNELNSLEDQKLLTKEQLIEYALQKVPDENARNDLKKLLSSVDINIMDKEEARKKMLDIVTQSYSQGANYSSGVTTFDWVAISLTVTALTLALIFGAPVGVRSCPYICYDVFDFWWGWYTECYYQC